MIISCDLIEINTLYLLTTFKTKCFKECFFTHIVILVRIKTFEMLNDGMVIWIYSMVWPFSIVFFCWNCDVSCYSPCLCILNVWKSCVFSLLLFHGPQVISDHTFFHSVTRIVCLGGKMAYHTLHSLNASKIYHTSYHCWPPKRAKGKIFYFQWTMTFLFYLSCCRNET